jgi:hypothetical protein
MVRSDFEKQQHSRDGDQRQVESVEKAATDVAVGHLWEVDRFGNRASEGGLDEFICLRNTATFKEIGSNCKSSFFVQLMPNNSSSNRIPSP